MPSHKPTFDILPLDIAVLFTLNKLGTGSIFWRHCPIIFAKLWIHSSKCQLVDQTDSCFSFFHGLHFTGQAVNLFSFAKHWLMMISGYHLISIWHTLPLSSAWWSHASRTMIMLILLKELNSVKSWQLRIDVRNEWRRIETLSSSLILHTFGLIMEINSLLVYH